MLRRRHQNIAVRNGFSLIELLVVVGIILTVIAFSLPIAMTSIQTARLTSAGSSFSSLLQTARLRAVNDDRYYSVYIQAAQGINPQLAYVDIYPQSANGTSGNGNPANGGGYNPGPPADPMVALSSEVTPQPQSLAPNVAGLYAKFCPTCQVGMIQNAAPTFGPAGVPCIPSPSSSGFGTVCNSSGGQVAYLVFFQSSRTQQWQAVTVTPSGRIRVWYYDGTAWAARN